MVVLTMTLALELGQYGFTCQHDPAPSRRHPHVHWPRPSRRGPRGRGDHPIRQLTARSPVRRLGVPEDIAATTAFLCSDDAGYITGQVIGVNGGNYT